MVIGISKRQQFRNERTLQDLIRSVPGNDRCADCEAMNPGWASWNMGIFLCMRCAAIHRKMGTHISKVKSLSMDSWTSEQVDNMKSHGNTLMNKIFNPRNVKPPVPADVDEADACMERFIRQKYQHRSLEDGRPKPPSRQDSSHRDRSPEGSPPPLPPKPSKPFGFGLRSASSATNLHRISTSQGDAPSPRFPSVGSQGMGASVGNRDKGSFESMMATLRDMGFQNERRNAIVLRELDGNLDKSIETLVRLGEGSNPTSGVRTPSLPTGASSNPFDQLDSKPPAQPTGQSYNPFDMPTTQPQPQPQLQLQSSSVQQPLEQSFQNLQVSQPLFPHSTGGHPPQQQTPFSQPYYLQSATPPASAALQGSFVSSPQPLDGSHNPFFQPGAQPQVTPPIGQTNPFFAQVPSMQPQGQAAAGGGSPGFPPPRHANTMPALPASSPFGQPSPFQSQPPSLQVQPAQLSPNPFPTMTTPATPQSAGFQVPSQFAHQTSTQHLVPQPTGRLNKNTILSLYNVSPAPSMIPENPQFQSSAGLYPVAPGATSPYSAAPLTQQSAAAARTQSSISSFPQTADSQAGSRNPFVSTVPGPGAAPAPQQQGLTVPAPPTAMGAARSHMSQQSVDISGFQNGRHSPDAFANLSARYG
ncbi:putative GTPase activating protein for Arf [Aspergillus tanneri]|uniref:Arf-GAP domain-containing protein n=1 Tax=Aspergillus tanneri TaxID=1220188 RepID=A0A5M9N2Z2_9EURO|nr:uncharacterized protein ATNIH1004_004816 [Aspergillus tanneri]KAA8648927.1 hypothetical protein ATNIH1004_004816 [Aspergillus tanneri]